jgi:hypothetical protein
MLTVLGGLAGFERDLIRTRTGAGRENGPSAKAYPAPAARSDQAPRPGRGIIDRDWPQLQRQCGDDFETGRRDDLKRLFTCLDSWASDRIKLLDSIRTGGPAEWAAI